MCKKCCQEAVSKGAEICKVKDHTIQDTGKCETAPATMPMEVEMPPLDSLIPPLPSLSPSEHTSSPPPTDKFELISFTSTIPKCDVQYVADLIHSSGPDDEVLVKVGCDIMMREDLRRLDGPRLGPGQKDTDLWLSDRNVKCWVNFLRLNSSDDNYFSDSFFYQDMMQAHYVGPARGTYNYKNGEGRCKKSPGKSLLRNKANYLPILVGESHWIAVAILSASREILLYDAKDRTSFNQYTHDSIMDNIKQLLIDEFKRTEVVWTDDEVNNFAAQWSLRDVSQDQQENGKLKCNFI